MWEHLPKIEGELQFEPWLFRIAANAAIDHLRKEKKCPTLSLSSESVNEQHIMNDSLATPGPEEAVCTRDYFEKALALVSPQLRICLLLQDQWGYSQREIAALLSITVKCVGSYICRGREQFRQAHRDMANESDTAGKGELTQ